MTRKSDLNRVIEAIDHLRSRKNRPNLPAIARFLSKAHGFPSDKTINLVDQLLSQNRVKEVVYKGNISFRNMLCWRQPNKPVSKKLDAQVNSSIVVSTMLRLLVEDQECDSSESAGGIAEKRLEASLIEQLGGAVQLQEIRNQIRSEVDKGTLERNESGDFVLSEKKTRDSIIVDLDMDNLSDSLELADVPESSPETSKEHPTKSNSVKTTKNLKSNSTSPIPMMSPAKTYYDKLQNLCLSIENVVNYDKNTDDSDIMTEQEEIIEIPERPKITCQRPDPEKSSGICDNKRRRVIKKKKIYDPSEFEVTPIARRNRRKGSNAVVTASLREGANRARRKSVGSRSWNMNRDQESVMDLTSQPSSESLSDNISQESPKDKSRARGKPPAHVNKKCSICSSRADKKHPAILSCSLCLNIAHKDCVKNDSFYEGSKKWRCEDCKIYNPVVCSVCEFEANKKQVMLLCDFCQEFFHADCHYPSVPLPLSEDIWRCSTCLLNDKNDELKGKTEEEDVDKLSEEADGVSIKSENSPTSLSPRLSDKDSSPPPIQINQNPPQDSNLENAKTEAILEEPIVLPLTIKVSSCLRHKPDEPIPLVDDWTVKQVSDYFFDKFGQDVADAFQAQEIDGKFLKKMSRQYVTNDLGLQLGIALKVLYYVKKIQLGTNLLQQLWA